MSWSNDGKKGAGLVISAEQVAAGSPVTSDDMEVGVLDFVSFCFALTRAAATSVEWWYEGSPDGVNWYRLPVTIDHSAPPDATLDNGEFTWAYALGKEDWMHNNVQVTGLRGVRVVVDSTAGTTDVIDVFAYGEAYSAR